MNTTNLDHSSDSFGALPLSNSEGQSQPHSDGSPNDLLPWLSQAPGSREQTASPSRPFHSVVSSIASPLPAVSHYSTIPQSFANQMGPTAPFSVAGGLARPTSSSPSGMLPLASHLSFPRPWGGSAEPGQGQLPQVTSLAMPNAPLYYGQNAVWPARSFAPSNRPFIPAPQFRSGAPVVPQHLIRAGNDAANPPWNTPVFLPQYESGMPYPIEGIDTGDGWFNSQVVRPRPVNPQSPHDPYRQYYTAPQQEGILVRPPNPGTPTSVIVTPKTSRPVGRPKKSTVSAPPPDPELNPVPAPVAEPPVRSRPPSTRRKSKSVMLQDNAVMGSAVTPTDTTTPIKKPRKKKEKKTDGEDGGVLSGEAGTSHEANPAEGEKKKKKYSAKPLTRTVPPPPDLGAGYALRHKLPSGVEFVEGERIEASDTTNTWYKGKVIAVRQDVGQVYVHFEGWNSRYDEWIPMHGKRIRQVTDEKFTEHQDRYKVGDIVVARWKGQENKPSVIVEVPSGVREESEKYVVVAFDGMSRLLSSKALRRMSPVLRERFEEELKQLNAVSARLPELRNRTDTDYDQGSTTAVASYHYQQPNEFVARSHQFLPAASSNAPNEVALSQSMTPLSLPFAPPASSIYPTTVIQATSAFVGVDNPSHSAADMVESQYVKPRREPKKPLKFKDSVVEMGTKKKKKKKIDDDAVDNTKLENMLAQSEGPPAYGATLVGQDNYETVSTDVTPPPSHSPAVKKRSVALECSTDPNVCSLRDAPGSIWPTDAQETTNFIDALLQQGANILQHPVMSDLNDFHSASIPKSFPPSGTTAAVPSSVDIPPNFPFMQSVSDPSREISAPVLQAILQKTHMEDPLFTTAAGLDATSVCANGKPSGSKSGRPKQKTVAPKELVIRIDHNEFKCSVEDCNKSFRKQKLLKDHMKHYHNMTGDLLNAKASSKKKKISNDSSGADLSLNTVFNSDFDPYAFPGPLPEIPLDDPIFAAGLGMSDIAGDLPVLDSYYSNSAFPTERKHRGRSSWDEVSTGTAEKEDSGRKSRRKKKEDSSDSEDVLQYIQQDHELVHCRCHYELENGFMVQCELCATWQHGSCYDIDSLEDVPKHYVCDFCQTPKKVRFSQRRVCHDLQYLRSGKLPIFTPLPDDDDPLTGVHPSGTVQNRYQYRKLVADTLHCNEQLKDVKKIERAIFAVEEAQFKTDALVDSMCKDRAELSKFHNALLNIPEDLVKGLNFREIVDKFGVDTADMDDVKIEKDDKMNLENIPEMFPSVRVNGIHGHLDDMSNSVVGGANRDGGEYNPEHLENDADVNHEVAAEDLEADMDESNHLLAQLNGPTSPLYNHSPDLRASHSPEIPAVPPRVFSSRSVDNNRLSLPDAGHNGIHGGIERSQSPSSFSARIGDRSERHERSDGVSDGEGLPSVGASSDGSAMDDLMLLAPELDPEILALCSQFGEFGTLIKAILSRGEAVGNMMDKIQNAVLGLEKSCDEQYGTNFANTPHLAEKEAEEYKQKLIQQQIDLRKMERLAYVIDIEPHERLPQHRQMPGPLPIPPYPSLASSPVKVKGKSGKARKPKDPNAPKKPRISRKKMKTEPPTTESEAIPSLPAPKTPESVEIM